MYTYLSPTRSIPAPFTGGWKLTRRPLPGLLAGGGEDAVD